MSILWKAAGGVMPICCWEDNENEDFCERGDLAGEHFCCRVSTKIKFSGNQVREALE
jgi:hypothetical protein